MYFIYDCNNKIVGNSKGYKSFSHALTQQNRVSSPAYNAIWEPYNMRKLFGPSESEYLCKINFVE